MVYLLLLQVHLFINLFCFYAFLGLVSTPGSAASVAKHDETHLDEAVRTSHTQPFLDPACLCGHKKMLMT